MNDDYGFFKWDKDDEITLLLKTKILEERILEYVGEIVKKESLKEENDILTNKILKEKMKRSKAEMK